MEYRIKSDIKKEYNDEPVYYCKDCLSIKIKSVIVGSDLDFCDECGSTNIGIAHIEEWQKLYRERYGFDYINK